MKSMKVILPLGIVALGIGLTLLLIFSRDTMKQAALKKLISVLESKEQRATKEPLPPLVQVAHVNTQDVNQMVRSQGVVTAAQTVKLISEVSGKVLKLSDSFQEGRFFKKNDVLLTLEDNDYKMRLVQAQAQLAEARKNLFNEEAQAKIAVAEWKSLKGDKPVPALVQRKPQLEYAAAAVAAAKEGVKEANRNLAKCEILAPFDGRVRRQTVDRGQYVSVLSEIGEIYSIDYAEVRLPISQREMGLLDLPLTVEGQEFFKSKNLELEFKLGTENCSRQAFIDRVEGELDPRTRMFYLIAKVRSPYSPLENKKTLHLGTFVTAKIPGKELKQAKVISNHLLKNENSVWVVNSYNQIKLKKVNIVYRDSENVYVTSGLAENDKLCLTILSPMIDGKKVRVSEE